MAPPYNVALSRKSIGPKVKTVLIVDDDEGMRDTLTAILKREYLILTAATGEEGLAILNRKDVDLILLDVRLPGMSGLDLLTIVRENYSLVEVIMVSALSEVEVAVAAMEQGAYHYITKEFDYDASQSRNERPASATTRPARSTGPRATALRWCSTRGTA